MIKPRTLLHLLRAKVYITKTCFKLFILLDLHFNFLKPCLFCFYFIVFNFLGQKKVTISLKYFFAHFQRTSQTRKRRMLFWKFMVSVFFLHVCNYCCSMIVLKQTFYKNIKCTKMHQAGATEFFSLYFMKKVWALVFSLLVC